MRSDKATVQFEGRSLIEHAIAILRSAGLPVRISGNRPDLESLAPTVNDLGTSLGPLGGICGALRVTSVTYAVVIPVDLPLLPAELISVMQEIAHVTGDAVVMPSLNGYVQTFPVVLHRSTLPTLEGELEAGRRGCFAAFQAASKALGQKAHAVPVEVLVQAGQLRHPQGLHASRWFLNINSQADLERARGFGRPKSAKHDLFA